MSAFRSGAISRQREAVQDLAPMLWHSFGSIAALLQEVINVYPAINPPTLTVSRASPPDNRHYRSEEKPDPCLS